MARQIWLTRDEGEAIVDALMLTVDTGHGWDVEHRIREMFGMPTRDQQLAALGVTIEKYRFEQVRSDLSRGA